MARVKKAAIALWKLFVGAVLCQFPLTSILVVGWTYRAMQRFAVRRWQGAIPAGPPSAGVVETGACDAGWPNWLLASREARARRRAGATRRFRRTMHAGLGSLGANAAVGFRAVLNTWAVTLFPATLWTVGWYAGWDNSFNKGYEQHFVGIVLSWIGIVLFLPIMLYLPLAQARQAVTGHWRRFYDLRLLSSLIVRNPIRSLLLAAAYALVSLPLLILLALPVFFEQVFPQTSTMSDTEMLAFLNRYYFRVAVVGFAAYAGLRLLAARIYSDLMRERVQTAQKSQGELAGVERAMLSGLQNDRAGESGKSVPSISLSTGRAAWRTAVLLAALALWFSFVSQIYIREFLVYHPVRGFMNQPLVQLPWFRYVPDALERAGRTPPDEWLR